MSQDMDAFFDAIDELETALERSIVMTARMNERIAELRAARAEGRTLSEIVPAEKPPLLVQLLTDSSNLLHRYGNTVRRTEARALYSEGMTMEQIARLFGVTRQRVSALLRPAPGQDEV